MTRVATSRLTEATASLSPADRALVNLWVNRGLDDAAVARLIGMSEAAIAGRRGRIVEQLAATLGLPPDHVHAALDEITVAASSANGAGGAGLRGGGGLPAPPAGAAIGARSASEPATATAAAPLHRRRPTGWWLALGLAAIVAVGILLASVTSSGSGHRGRSSSATGGPAQTSSGAISRSSASRPRGDLLSALPGVAGHASGSVSAAGRLKLSLTVRNLAAANGGHYEIWLYNSLTSSVPLGRVHAGVDHLTTHVPRGADRYRWIDISYQPDGDVFHSGESRLRAANPLFGRTISSERWPR